MARKVSTFSERFRTLCNENPSSDSKLAEKLHISKQTVSAWKSGVRSPRVPTIDAIASFFNVNLDWLMGFDVDRYTGLSTRRYATDTMPPLLKVPGKASESGTLKQFVIQDQKKTHDIVQTLDINDPHSVIEIGADPSKQIILFRALGKLARKDPESAGEILAAMSENGFL